MPEPDIYASWTGSGPEYTVEWGDETWTLRLDAVRPGLTRYDFGPLLALEGLAEVGRWDPDALNGTCLIGQECRFNRVEATYAPAGWSETFVRAAWRPS